MDGLSVTMQRERAKTQMTLGKMINALEGMPEDAEVTNLHDPHSYRGYYCDLAFEQGNGFRPANDLLVDCKEAMGRIFEGYKGGEFMMGESTPIWLVSHGSTGLKLIALHVGGKVETEKDD